jgi:hypothetical protein
MNRFGELDPVTWFRKPVLDQVEDPNPMTHFRKLVLDQVEEIT